MRRWTLSLGMGSALVACLVIGVAGSARAATLDFTGALTLQLFGPNSLVNIPGAGVAQVTGAPHLASLVLPGGTFGPVTTSIDLGGYSGTDLSLAGVVNQSGQFLNGAGPMGLSGIAKLCLIFAPCEYANVPLPLAATGTPPVGFGIGGTQLFTGAINFTAQHAPWTVGQPVLTIHTPNTNVTTPTLPGGFEHGPALGRGAARVGLEGLHEPYRGNSRDAHVRRPDPALRTRTGDAAPARFRRGGARSSRATAPDVEVLLLPPADVALLPTPSQGLIAETATP
jgi:hypothetical protein